MSSILFSLFFSFVLLVFCHVHKEGFVCPIITSFCPYIIKGDSSDSRNKISDSRLMEVER